MTCVLWFVLGNSCFAVRCFVICVSRGCVSRLCCVVLCCVVLCCVVLRCCIALCCFALRCVVYMLWLARGDLCLVIRVFRESYVVACVSWFAFCVFGARSMYCGLRCVSWVL